LASPGAPERELTPPLIVIALWLACCVGVRLWFDALKREPKPKVRMPNKWVEHRQPDKCSYPVNASNDELAAYLLLGGAVTYEHDELNRG